MKYYLDSVIVIYLIERVSEYKDKLINIISEDAELIVSDLTRLECRVKPIQENDLEKLEEYDLFFKESTTIISLDTETIDKATQIRAEYAFKTPDSIHLAVAIKSNVDKFITNDKRLNRFKDIKIEQI